MHHLLVWSLAISHSIILVFPQPCVITRWVRFWERAVYNASTIVLFVSTLPLAHGILLVYGVAIWAQGVFRRVRTSFQIPYFPDSEPPRMALVPISGQWDEEGRYSPSEDEVNDGMVRWQMAPGDERQVWHWLKSLRENTWLATALYFPYLWQGIMGVFLCLSTPESTRQSKVNSMVENQRRMGGIDTPEYLFFTVYFYPGMVFGNLAGFGDSHAQPLGTLADVFNQLCTEARIASWRQDVFVRPGGWVYAGFRTVLQLLRIPVHAEVVSGLSYRRMASLDVFVATHTGAMGMGPPPMALWTASYDDTNSIRYFPKQDYWWYMPVWRSAGQGDASNTMDYQVDLSMHPHVQRVLTEMVRHARAGDAAAARRIGHLLGHMTPDVFLQGSQMAVLRPLTNNDGQRGMLPITDGRIPEEEERRNSNL